MISSVPSSYNNIWFLGSEILDKRANPTVNLQIIFKASDFQALTIHPLIVIAFTFHFHALEKEMATHSSVLSWRIPGTGKPGGLPSMGSHRVRHD